MVVEISLATRDKVLRESVPGVKEGVLRASFPTISYKSKTFFGVKAPTTTTGPQRP